MGSKKNAIWRVVVADRRSPRDGRFIEMIGHYNPQTEPSQIVIDEERLQHWLERGAEPSNTVKKLMRARASAAAGAGAAVGDESDTPDAEEGGAEAEAATAEERQPQVPEPDPDATEAGADDAEVEAVEGEDAATGGDAARDGESG